MFSFGILGFFFPPCGCGQASGAVGAAPVTGGHVAAVGVSWQEWAYGMVMLCWVMVMMMMMMMMMTVMRMMIIRYKLSRVSIGYCSQPLKPPHTLLFTFVYAVFTKKCIDIPYIAMPPAPRQMFETLAKFRVCDLGNVKISSKSCKYIIHMFMWRVLMNIVIAVSLLIFILILIVYIQIYYMILYVVLIVLYYFMLYLV